MSGTEETAVQWSTHDRACSHCRVRKIRCGRERPQCTNCKRDKAECDFSDNGKRINHIKLLVNNVGGLEDRLISIEKELVRLTDQIQKGNERLSGGITPESGSPSSFSDDELSDNFFLQPVDRHMVRSQDDFSDRYHGPCTLLALCNEFRDLVVGTQEQGPQTSRNNEVGLGVGNDEYVSLSEAGSSKEEKSNALLTTMCMSVSVEEPINLHSDNTPICLPPKQFVVMAHTSFFQQEDPTVDIFCQASFLRHVDMIYSRHLSQADDAWALCFNIIILLVLGAEQSGSGNGPMGRSQFALPFLSTVRSAMNNLKLLMAPKLINVQALALLSVVAHQYQQPSFAEAILAQACLLAKTMGLHQERVSGGGTTPEEEEERSKVFRSLFLRDKALSLSRGKNCWLPSFDCSLAYELEKTHSTNSNMPARLHLARLQEEIYRALYSTESLRQSTTQRKAALSKMEKSLQRWIGTYGDIECEEPPRPLDMQLDFRAARIFALRSSSDPMHVEQVLHDARASCRLLSPAFEISNNSSSLNTKTSLPEPSSGNIFPALPGVQGIFSNDIQPVIKPELSRVRSLVESFPVPAFFVIAKNILWPICEDQTACDINLLRNISQLFQKLDHCTQTNNYARKVSIAFLDLLAILNILRPEHSSKLQQPSYQDPQTQGQQRLSPHQNLQINLASSLMTEFQNAASVTPYPPLTFPGPNMLVHSTSNSIRTTSPPFQLLTPLEFNGSSNHYDPTRQSSYASPPDQYPKKRRLSNANFSFSPNNGRRLYSYFPDLSSGMSLDGEQQNDGVNAEF